MLVPNRHASSNSYRYGFIGKEKDDEVKGEGNSYDFGARLLDPRVGRWFAPDPKERKFPNYSTYNYSFNSVMFFVDLDGMIPIPLNSKYKNWYLKSPDSWFGPRNTGLKGASSNHKGLDFNYSGGGNTDIGATVLAAHDGIVSVDNNPNGSEGRMITITSIDKKVRTRYMHLSKITVENEAQVSEASTIGELGGSAYGKETGRTAHLHYEVQILDEKTGNYVSIDPTQGLGHDVKNIIDPQKLIEENINKTETKTKPNTEVIVVDEYEDAKMVKDNTSVKYDFDPSKEKITKTPELDLKTKAELGLMKPEKSIPRNE